MFAGVSANQKRNSRIRSRRGKEATEDQETGGNATERLGRADPRALPKISRRPFHALYFGTRRSSREIYLRNRGTKIGMRCASQNSATFKLRTLGKSPILFPAVYAEMPEGFFVHVAGGDRNVPLTDPDEKRGPRGSVLDPMRRQFAVVMTISGRACPMALRLKSAGSSRHSRV